MFNLASVWTVIWTFFNETKYCCQIYINIDFMHHRVYGSIQFEIRNYIKTKVFEYEYFILEYYYIEIIDSQIHLAKIVFKLINELHKKI